MPVFHLPSFDLPEYHVYALFCQDKDGPGYVKFGMSRQITKRLTQLRQGCPIPAKMFATVPVGASKDKALQVERALHKVFVKKHSSGEWFKLDLNEDLDNRIFIRGSQKVFVHFFGADHPWWSQFSVEALDKYNKERQVAFLKSKHKRKIAAKAKYRARQQAAWKELAS